MSPTVYHEDDGGFRFFFFSREESRIHIHVSNADGNAKFWLEPSIELAKSSGLSSKQLKKILHSIEEHEDEIRTQWQHHFGQ